MVSGNERLAEGIELLDIGVGVFDADLRLVRANSAFRRLRRYPDDLCTPGVSLEDLLRFNAERGDFGAGDIETQVRARISEIETHEQREIEQKHADGQVLRVCYRHMQGGDLILTYEDRTEEHRAREALAASEERYALVSEAAEEAIYDWDIAAKRFYTSPRLARMIGREMAETGDRGWAWEEIVHPDDVACYSEELERHLSGERQRWSCEYRMQVANGRWCWVSDHGTSVRDETGRAIRMVAAIQDISSRVERDKALAESEERYMLVTQATSDGIYDWNVTDDLLYVSDNLRKLLDFELGLKSSRKWAARVHADDIEAYGQAIRRHFKGIDDAVDIEYRILTQSGDYRWVHDRGVGVRNAEGRVTRLVGAVRDVTEIKAAKDKLDRTENLLSSAMTTISDGLLIVDPEGRVQLWNERYAEIFFQACGGEDITEVIVKGRPFFDMIRHGYRLGMFKPHPDGDEGWIAERMAAWEKPAAQLELELANGTWILLNESRTPDGGRVSIYTDVTELKRREEESAAARARFEEAIEAISSGFALWDADDRLVISNSRYKRYFRDIADLVTPGARFMDIIRVAVDRGMFPQANADREAFFDEIAKKRANPCGLIREQHLSDGLWLQITDHRTADGGVVSIYADVSELKKKQIELTAEKERAEAALENLRKAQERLVQSEKMASLGQLTAGIAHEIKNPLNFVLNFSSLSSELVDELAEGLAPQLDALDEEAREDLEGVMATIRANLDKILQHGRRADSIVKNMLLHSREGPSELQKVNVNAVAEEAMNLAYHGARAENSSFNIEMKSTLADDLGEIPCYPQDLMRVFLNLISNGMYSAVKRQASEMDGFEPEIALTTRKCRDGVEIEIRDNGPGIPPEVRDRIFTPFFTTKPAGEGTGLGLSLSYNIIVKQHGGDIHVDSTPGEFTTFRVVLPTEVAHTEAPPPSEGVSPQVEQVAHREGT